MYVSVLVFSAWTFANRGILQWLKTDMGSENADLPVDVGVKEVIRLMQSSGPESTGKFLNIHVPGWENAPGPNKYDGKEPPW